VTQHRGEDPRRRGGFESDTHRGGENVSLTKLHKCSRDNALKFDTAQLGKQPRSGDHGCVFGIGSDNEKIHRGSVEDQQFWKRDSGCGRKPLSEIAEPGCFGTIGRLGSKLMNDRIVDSGSKGAHPDDHGYCGDHKTDDQTNDARNSRKNCSDDQAQ
jgi:hypothetical protein